MLLLIGSWLSIFLNFVHAVKGVKQCVFDATISSLRTNKFNEKNTEKGLYFMIIWRETPAVGYLLARLQTLPHVTLASKTKEGYAVTMAMATRTPQICLLALKEKEY